jgi:hypothetical protein
MRDRRIRILVKKDQFSLARKLIAGLEYFDCKLMDHFHPHS